MDNKKIAQTGLLVAVAFVFSYIESLIPLNLGVPGIKIGLSNLVVLFALYMMSYRISFGISMVRIFLVGLTFGNLAAMLYSLAGGLLSFGVMALLKKSGKFSVYGVSLAGGVAHNIGQILVACLVLRTSLLLYYLPFLLVSGVTAGLLIGILGGMILRRLSHWNRMI